MTQKLSLTEEQKDYIRQNYQNVPGLTELTQAVFLRDNLDGRSKEGRAIRSFMQENELEYVTRHIDKKEDVVLDSEQQEFILNNLSSGMTCLQITQLLFPDLQATHLSKEYQSVHSFVDESGGLPACETAINTKYSTPKATSKIIKKINDFSGEELEEKKLNLQQKLAIESLGKFLSAPRFLQVINNYSDVDDRTLFEAEFVRATWDKPDLTSDEINLYINVCMDYIHLKNIHNNINKLNRMFDEAEDQQDLTVRLAELLKTKSEEYNQCEKRMESLIQKLQGDRAKRVANKERDNASLLSLVQLFQAEEERKIMLKIAARQRQAVSEETDILENMPEWKSRVLGISKDDVI
jgi:phage gpG-like protein